jgi:hypothetical protein
MILTWKYSELTLTWQRMVELIEDMWEFFGRVLWCHVAQAWTATWHPILVMVCKRFMESVGIEPRTSPKVQCFWNVQATIIPHSGTCYVMV